MKFGKVDNLSAVNFQLPPDNPLNQQVFDQLEKTDTPNFHMGAPVWGYAGFLGKIYPRGTKSKDYLYHYCRQFNAVEANVTHYKIPEATTVAKWKKASTKGFKFCPKFPQFISHRRELHKKQELVNQFIAAVYDLGDALGPAFIQLPDYFGPDHFDSLKKFVEQLPVDFKIAVEIRNAHWFENHAEVKRLFEMLAGHNLSWVITDVAGRRDVLHQSITTDFVFIRFTGNALHPSDYIRLDEWVERLVYWWEQGVKDFYIMLHQPQEELCADLAIYLADQLMDKTGLKINKPNLLNASQNTLFG